MDMYTTHYRDEDDYDATAGGYQAWLRRNGYANEGHDAHASAEPIIHNTDDADDFLADLKPYEQRDMLEVTYIECCTFYRTHSRLLHKQARAPKGASAALVIKHWKATYDDTTKRNVKLLAAAIDTWQAEHNHS